MFTHPTTTRITAAQSSPCHRVAEVLAVFTDRGSEFTSAACVAVCDRLGWGVPWAALGRAEINTVAESFVAALKIEFVERQHSRTQPPRRSAGLDLPLRWESA